jgi:hypothetical protein
LAQKIPGGWIEGVDRAIAKVADQDVVAEAAEVRVPIC